MNTGEKTPETVKKTKLSEEQKKWVKEQLELDPNALNDAQKTHIVAHWNGHPTHTEFVQEKIKAKAKGVEGFELTSDEIRVFDEEWLAEKAREDEEFRRLFPPKPLTPEEQKEHEELTGAFRKATEMREKLFKSIMDIPEAEWIIEAIAVKEGITLLYGDPGIGKTSLMLQLVGCAFEGKDFIGLKGKKVTPLLVEQDENPTMLKTHVERMLPAYPSLKNLEVPQKTVLWDDKKGNFTDKTLEELIQYSGLASLVIIDSLTSLGITDINHPSCSIVFDKLRALARDWKCSFIVIHHPNKSGEYMGSKLIHAKVDVMLNLQKGKLCFQKLRGVYPAMTQFEVNQMPFIPVQQDEKTLVFRIDRAIRIAQLRTQGKQRADIIKTIMTEYGGSKEAVTRAVDRGKDK